MDDGWDDGLLVIWKMIDCNWVTISIHDYNDSEQDDQDAITFHSHFFVGQFIRKF